MKPKLMRYRWLSTRLPPSDRRRIAVITGPRQTGKTTLVRRRYPELRYLNLDDHRVREQLRSTTAPAWARDVGHAVVDEAQKEPSVFEKVKYSYDEGAVDFSVLLGSSRMLMLERVNETLAGRAFLYELWPLTLSELLHSEHETPELPLLDRLLDGPVGETLRSVPGVLLGDEEDRRRQAGEHLSTWGGMPELLRLEDDERREWLGSYQQTWIERDLVDIARLDDYHQFRKLQRLAMLRSGQLLNYAELGRDAQVAASTVRRHLGWLFLTFQLIEVPPFLRNLTSALVKSPKLYWADVGLLRQGTGQWGPLTGALFETLVVSELHKWIQVRGRSERLTFYRTRSGMELDLLVGNEGAGWLGVECKARAGVHRSDVGPMRKIAAALGDGWRGGIVVHQGDRIEEIDRELGIWGVPLNRLL